MITTAGRTTTLDEAQQQVVSAARRVFARFGVAKTTIDDIAREAALPRSALYRIFDNRTEIIAAAIGARVEELSRHLKEVLDATTTFEEALIEVSAATVELGRNDEEFRNLIDTHTGIAMHDFLTGPNPLIHGLIRDFWSETFSSARGNGQIDAEVTDDELVEWLSGVWMMLILRTDLTRDAERRTLRNFLLPSILRHNR